LSQKDEVYLNLVLEYVPETVYRVARNYSKNKQTLPPILIKVDNWWYLDHDSWCHVYAVTDFVSCFGFRQMIRIFTLRRSVL